MNPSTKRFQSPQEGTPNKKARGTYDPRSEAVAPKKKTPAKAETTETEQATTYSDSDSEARDKAYLEGEKAREINFDFELALDEDNIKEALAMATTDEQRERARKAAEYIEQVGRQIVTWSYNISSSKNIFICLQVKSRANVLTEPKNRIMPSFKNAPPRFKAAAKAANNYAAQVCRTSNSTHMTISKNNLSFQLKIGRAICNDMDTNNNSKSSEALKKAAAAGAAESAKANRSTGFTPPGSRTSSTPKGSSPPVMAQFKPGTPALNLNLRPQKPNSSSAPSTSAPSTSAPPPPPPPPSTKHQNNTSKDLSLIHI